MAIFLIHDIHAILMMVPGQDPEKLYIAPESQIIYNAFLFVPLRQAFSNKNQKFKIFEIQAFFWNFSSISILNAYIIQRYFFIYCINLKKLESQSLIYSILAGLSLGLSARMELILKYDLLWTFTCNYLNKICHIHFNDSFYSILVFPKTLRRKNENNYLFFIIFGRLSEFYNWIKEWRIPNVEFWGWDGF